MSKNIRFTLSDQQMKKYEHASQKLLALGFPITSQSLVQILTANREEDEIVEEFLSLMKNLVNNGRRQLNDSKSQEKQK